MDAWVIFPLLTFIASTVGTVTGFGTSTIMVPVLLFFLPLPETLLLAGVVHWFGDIWKIIFFKKGLNRRLILMFGVPGIVLSFWAARLPLVLPTLLLQRSLGFFLVAYVLFLFWRPTWKIPATIPTAVAGGALSGFLAGIFGVGGAVRSAFLSAFDLKKSVFLFTSGVIGLLIDSSRLSQYWLGGVRLENQLGLILLLCLPLSLAGAYLAKKLVDKVPQRRFRQVVAVVLFLVGLRYLIVQ